MHGKSAMTCCTANISCICVVKKPCHIEMVTDAARLYSSGFFVTSFSRHILVTERLEHKLTDHRELHLWYTLYRM
jgi:hypothetical protein